MTLPLLRLGRLRLDPGLRDFQPDATGPAAVVTATVPAPQAPAGASSLQYAWDVAWDDAARRAAELGADQVPPARFGAADLPGRHETHPGRPPAQHHGPRHLTGSEPESGGQRNAGFIAGERTSPR